jgi:hypothetical protein
LVSVVPLPGQVQRLAVDLNSAAVQVDGQLARLDDGIRVASRAPDNGLDAGDQLAPVERLGEIVVRADAEPFDLVVQSIQSGQDEDGGLDAGGAQSAQHFVAIHVGQHQIQDDDVVVVKLADFEPILAHVRDVTDKALRPEHHLYALGGCGIILD